MITVFDIQNSIHLSVRNFLKTQFYFHKLMQISVRKILKSFFIAVDHYCFIKMSHGLKKIVYNGDLDVTMESFEGAEVCELAGLFILNKLSKKFDKDNIGLYRDDGLSVFKNYNGHLNDKIQKEMIDLFKQHHLNLEIKCNLEIVDYLDIAFDLTTGLFKPYNKTNNLSRHVNTK